MWEPGRGGGEAAQGQWSMERGDAGVTNVCNVLIQKKVPYEQGGPGNPGKGPPKGAMVAGW